MLNLDFLVELRPAALDVDSCGLSNDFFNIWFKQNHNNMGQSHTTFTNIICKSSIWHTSLREEEVFLTSVCYIVHFSTEGHCTGNQHSPVPVRIDWNHRQNYKNKSPDVINQNTPQTLIVCLRCISCFNHSIYSSKHSKRETTGMWTRRYLLFCLFSLRSFTNTQSDTLAWILQRAHTVACARAWVCTLSPSAAKCAQTSHMGWKKRERWKRKGERQRQRDTEKKKGQNKFYRVLHSSLQVHGVCMCVFVCGKWVLGVVVSLR